MNLFYCLDVTMYYYNTDLWSMQVFFSYAKRWL